MPEPRRNGNGPRRYLTIIQDERGYPGPDARFGWLNVAWIDAEHLEVIR